MYYVSYITVGCVNIMNEYTRRAKEKASRWRRRDDWRGDNIGPEKRRREGWRRQ